MKGEVVYLYAFDVASEIATEKVGQVLSQKPFPFEIRMDRTVPKDIPLYRPLAIQPAELPSTLRGRPVRPLVRIYDVGVVSIAMRVPVEPSTLADLIPFHNPLLEDGSPLDAVAERLCREISRELRPFMVSPSPDPELPEAYTVFCLTEIEGASDLGIWISEESRAVAGLLTETEASRLSAAQTTEVLRVRQSFENTDLVIIDWDAALAVDLAGYVDDVLYVLELANLQVEEFRLLDRRLDKYMDRAYEDLRRRPFPLFGAASVSLRTLRRLGVEVAQLTDEVTHIAKFFGDWYLARVYLGARERFHLEGWQKSVEGRLAQLNHLYQVARTETNERRMLWLEILIVIFFAIEIIRAFLAP